MNAVTTLDASEGLTLRIYERGCALLEQCITFDETKYWDSLADAAAAWGKIHNSDRVERLARALKLHAYRRLGEIAETQKAPVKAAKGRPPGPVAWLQSNGMSRNEAQAARGLANMGQAQFDELAGRAKPPLPVSVRKGHYTEWQRFYGRASLANVAAHTLRTKPTEAAEFDGLERSKARTLARRLERWFKEFADALETSRR
jgi:hypothetical protein